MLSNIEESTEETLREAEIDEGIDASNLNGYIQILIPSDQMIPSDQRSHRRRFFDFLRAHTSIARLRKLKLSSPFAVLQRTVSEMEEISLSVPSTVGVQQHFHTQFIRKLKFKSLMNIFKEWIKHPMNIALLTWLICVAISASMLVLLLLGLLNGAFPTKSSRNRWIEINNQVLNALFTLMSLYQHPNLFHHLVLLLRWRSQDIIELRKIYCKNGAYRPHEWAHMTLVVILLHVTCFAQYFLCGLYWGYSSAQRPEFAENFFFVLGTVAPLLAGVYTIYSPLGREFDINSEEELHDVKVSDKFAVATVPEWIGGLFDCRDDMTVGCLSFFCTFCVFGWNMERLGFGNMYVHMVTFFLLCVAPFWIFSIAALNISNDVIRDVVGIAGMVLCLFGLLYGGFWRIKMRTKLKLLGNRLCCGSDSMTDYIQWMFCWACSLAQEVRTVNFYDVDDDTLRGNDTDSGGEGDIFLAALPCEDGSRGASSANYIEIDGNYCARGDELLVVVEVALNDAMVAPSQPSIQSECRGSHSSITAHVFSLPVMQKEELQDADQTQGTQSL